MRSRALICLLVGAGLALQMAPAGACERILGVAVDCSPTPTPTPTKRRATAEPKNPTGDLFERIDGERERRGLAPLRFDSTVTAIAKRHAARMAARGKIYHNSALGSGETRGRLGHPSFVMENVGFGPTAAKVHKAFMTSASHRKAILYPAARVVGIGVVRRDGKLWISQVFQDRNAPGGRAASPRSEAPEASGEVPRTGSTVDTVVALPPMTTDGDGTTQASAGASGVAALAAVGGSMALLGLSRRRRGRV